MFTPVSRICIDLTLNHPGSTKGVRAGFAFMAHTRMKHKIITPDHVGQIVWDQT